MKKNSRTLVILITLILFLSFFFKAVIEKEKTLSEGKLILLELAPVDPRSLMQGDYMQLKYKINNTIIEKEKRTLGAKRGYVTLKIDSLNIGHFVSISDTLSSNNGIDDLIAIKYFNGDAWNISIGAESYFFQEGKREQFEEAKYGGLKVDDKGNSILIGLYDKKRKLISFKEK